MVIIMEKNNNREYRRFSGTEGLTSFTIKIKETDLFISAASNLAAEATSCVLKCRKELEEYSAFDPVFLRTLSPHCVPEWAPEIVKKMAEAASAAGVGPMAAVAGAISESVGRYLLKYSPEVIVENGGDIFISASRPVKIGIFAGSSPFSNRIALRLDPAGRATGVCTSSGTLGHSLSFGKADAAVIIAEDPALADAVATATGNRIKTPKDIKAALEFALSIKGVKGALVIIGEHMGVMGEVKLEKI
ncbi:MAG: uncharacterized protein PWP45_1569 [Tepidanaerobacteraceae bacterium]|nr:uncharacterized protein [Tepidanaerobacteraceae bacterium]